MRDGHIFHGYIINTTHAAVLFECHLWDEPDFIPKSQIEVIRDPDTHEVELVISNWLCSRKGVREYGAAT